MEFSTPFVNFRWFLEKANLKASKVYIVNGILMVVSFFFARLFFIPITYYLKYQHWRGVLKLPHSLFYQAVVGYIIMSILNLFWMKKMISGILSILKKNEKDNKKDKKKD
jgi:hypothetical protein